MNKLECQICGRIFKNIRGLSVHVGKSHKELTKQEYYDKYFKLNGEDICNHPECNKKVNFSTFGYNKYCSHKCLNNDPKMIEENRKQGKLNWKNLEFREKVINGNKEFWKNNLKKKKEVSERAKQMWKDPILRQQMVNSLKSNGQNPEFIEKQKLNAEKISKDPEWRKRVSEGTKRGQEKNPNFKKDRRKYMLNGGAAHCNRFIKNPSKPQVELFELCQKLLPYPILNYPCLNFSIDIAIPILGIAIEYDGSYWHQDSEKDINRQRLIEEEGWNFIRYKDRIPSKVELFEDIERKL